MLSRFPFLPGGLALIASACAMPQTGLRRTTPMEHTVLRGEQLHTERQILEGRDIKLLTVYGNLAIQDSRPMTVQLSRVLDAPMVGETALRITEIVQQNQYLLVAYASPDGRALGALALIDITDPEAPVLRAELQLPQVAVTALAIEGDQVYFAGTSVKPGQAVVARISFQGFEWQDDLKIQTVDLSAVGSLALLDERLLVLDRGQSQLVTLNKKDLSVNTLVNVPGLSRMGRSASSLWAYRDEQIIKLDADLHVQAAWATGVPANNVVGPLRVGQEMVLSSLGEEGVRAFCQTEARPLFYVPNVIRAELKAEPLPTLDAALDQGLLVTANAEAGVYLYTVSTGERSGSCKTRTVKVEGYLNLGKEFRAETLNWQQDLLTVADGQGRLNLFYIDRDTVDTDDSDFNVH
jgi:hypothetical protein